MGKTAIIQLVAFALILAGTQGGCVNNISEEAITDITFEVHPSYSSSPFATKGSINGTSLNKACKRLSYYITDGEKIISKGVQNSEEKSFGTIEGSFPYGTYQLFFVAHNGNYDAVIDTKNHTSTFDRVSDTFFIHATLTVDEDTEPTQQIVLNRCVTKFELLAKDAIPIKSRKAVFVVSGGGVVLNLLTGKCASLVVQDKEIDIPSTALGTSGNTFSLYSFLPQGETGFDIQFTVRDENDAVVAAHHLINVPMKLNRITRYSGNAFSEKISFTDGIEVNGEWEPVLEGSF